MTDPNPLLIQPPSLSTTASPTPIPTPLILIHDGGGTIFQYFLLSPLHRPLYGLSNPHFETGEPWPGGLREMAAHYAKLIQDTVPGGRVLLGGWSLGGYLALEVAHILVQQDHPALEVVGILMIDSRFPGRLRQVEDEEAPAAAVAPRRINRPLVFRDTATPKHRRVQVQRCFDQATEMVEGWAPPLHWRVASSGVASSDVASATNNRASPYLRKAVAGAQPPPTILLRAVDRVPTTDSTDGTSIEEDPVDEQRQSKFLGWENYNEGFICDVLDVSGHHFSIFGWENHESVSAQLRRACELLER